MATPVSSAATPVVALNTNTDEAAKKPVSSALDTAAQVVVKTDTTETTVAVPATAIKA